jgi:hypothetical protein
MHDAFGHRPGGAGFNEKRKFIKGDRDRGAVMTSYDSASWAVITISHAASSWFGGA